MLIPATGSNRAAGWMSSSGTGNFGLFVSIFMFVKAVLL